MKFFNKYKKILFAILVLGTPTVSFAQGISGESFSGSMSLWVAVAIGIIAGVVILRNAHKIGPSLLRNVYNAFGIGMLLVVLALVAVVIPSWATDLVVARIHDVLLILGFGFMASGAGRMLTAVGLK